MTYLLALAVIPGIVLLVYIFKKDRADKEPLDLLLKLLGFGALICFPASAVEGVLNTVLQNIFTTEPFGSVLLRGIEYYLYNFFDAFFVVALVEEGFKWVVLYFFTRKNKNFNSLFDGIIYAVFVSLGFAILENILYVFSYGLSTALIRAVTAVPGHMFFGIIMGYCYTLWHSANVAAGIEKHFISKGLLPQKSNAFKPGMLLSFSIIMPVIAHGFYDFCCFIENAWATIVFYLFLICLYIYCFATVKKMSALDTGNYRYSILWFKKKYPAMEAPLIEYLNARQQEAAFQRAYVRSYPVNYQQGYTVNTQGYTPGTQSYNTGAQNYNTGAQNYNTGAQNYNAAAQNYNANAQTYNASAQSYNTGAQENNTNPQEDNTDS